MGKPSKLASADETKFQYFRATINDLSMKEICELLDLLRKHLFAIQKASKLSISLKEKIDQ